MDCLLGDLKKEVVTSVHNIKMALPTKDNIDEWVSKYENAFLNKSNDNGQVLAKIYCGIDTYYNNPKYKNINYKTDLEKMLKNIFDIEK